MDVVVEFFVFGFELVEWFVVGVELGVGCGWVEVE